MTLIQHQLKSMNVIRERNRQDYSLALMKAPPKTRKAMASFKAFSIFSIAASILFLVIAIYSQVSGLSSFIFSLTAFSLAHLSSKSSNQVKKLVESHK